MLPTCPLVEKPCCPPSRCGRHWQSSPRKGRFMMRSSLLFVLPALALAACNTNPDKNAVRPGTGAGINVAWMDKSVAPGDDFFAYSNGTWIKTNEIPADRSSIGAHVIADELREKNTRELFDAILKANPTSGNDALIAHYYNAYVNTDAIDKAGLAPAKADLDAINSIADKTALSAAIGNTIRADTDPLNNTNFHTENLFGIFVTQGLATPGEQLPYLMQGGLGLPEREYYLSADPKMAELKNKYRAYVAQILGLAGHPDAQGAAGRIVDLETKIAEAHATREESEDFGTGTQVWSRADLEKKAPGIDWGALLDAAQLSQVRKFDAYHPNAIPK